MSTPVTYFRPPVMLIPAVFANGSYQISAPFLRLRPRKGRRYTILEGAETVASRATSRRRDSVINREQIDMDSSSCRKSL